MTSAETKSLKASESELLAYLEAINARNQAFAVANGWTVLCNASEDIQMYRELGISSIAEYREWCAQMEEQEEAKEERKSWSLS